MSRTIARVIEDVMPRRAVLKLGTACLASGALWCGAGQATVSDPVNAAHVAVAHARAQAAVMPLRALPALDVLAARQAAHVMRQDRTTHYNADGHDPAARAVQMGYAGTILGEALAKTPAETRGDSLGGSLGATEDGARAIIAAWLAEPATRAVLLNPAARHLGLTVQIGDQSHWWCLLTAR